MRVRGVRTQFRTSQRNCPARERTPPQLSPRAGVRRQAPSAAVEPAAKGGSGAPPIPLVNDVGKSSPPSSRRPRGAPGSCAPPFGLRSLVFSVLPRASGREPSAHECNHHRPPMRHSLDVASALRWSVDTVGCHELLRQPTSNDKSPGAGGAR